MRCLICYHISLRVLCKRCLDWIGFDPKMRRLDGVSVYSFFDYDMIENIIKSKYSLIGSRAIKVLAREAAFFACKQHFFDMLSNVRGVGIDDRPKGGYSHTAIIARAFHQIASIKPIYGGLYAASSVRYAGQKLAFRRNNPKKFMVNFTAQDAPYGVVLYDDLITTGTTMQEAIHCLGKQGIRVNCGFALATASYQGTSLEGVQQ